VSGRSVGIDDPADIEHEAGDDQPGPAQAECHFVSSRPHSRSRHYGSDMSGDADVVAAIVAGDPSGLAEAYDRYAVPLRKFCSAMLREPADAADAVQDTFVIAASRLSGLEDPQRLRPWLYAVARNECLRRLQRSSRLAPIEGAAELTDEAVDVAGNAEQAELRALVRDALSGLGSAEREVLELQIRHGLTNAEVASILGVTRNHLHAILSRARDQLETSLGVLAVARTGRRDCPVLDTLLRDWDGRLTVLLRKRVSRHLQRCPVCSGRQRREMTPAMLLGVTPIIALPLAAALRPGFRDQVLQAATAHSHAAAVHGATVARTAYSFGPHGFPRPLASPRAPWWHTRPAHVGALATATAVVAAVTVIAMPHRHDTPPAGGTVLAPAVTNTSVFVTTVTSGTASGGDTSAGSSGPAGATAPARASASASAARSGASVPGTLSVSPAYLAVVPPASGALSLTASGGPVAWSVSEPPGLAKKVIVSPMSGTLAADATTTVRITVHGPGKMHVHLVFSPGGTRVTVVIS
jgi:RNA polymerase sigma factor (sigma-70 family)